MFEAASRKIDRPWGVALSLTLASLLVACVEEAPQKAELQVLEQALIDCGESTDTGYVSGTPFAITVVTVDGEPVEVQTANAYWVMQQAAAADGVGIVIVSGFRTNAEQQYLYNCYVNCNCNNCNLAARPGYSNHQSGHALDLNTSSAGVLAWLNANGAAFGFTRTVASEDWHWEWWGGGPGGGPCGPQCGLVGAGGGVLDDAGACFHAFGPAAYWRQVNGVGQDGGLQWTNAFQAAAPSCWGRWTANMAAAGDFVVEVNTVPGWGVWPATRYVVRHNGVENTVLIDQSAVDGWQTLGVFTFAAGADQHVDVFDNYVVAVPADQHIMADAVRLSPWVAPQPELDPEPNPELSPEPDPELTPEPDAELSPEPDPELSPEWEPELNPEPAEDLSPDADLSLDAQDDLGGGDVVNMEVEGICGCALRTETGAGAGLGASFVLLVLLGMRRRAVHEEQSAPFPQPPPPKRGTRTPAEDPQ